MGRTACALLALAVVAGAVAASGCASQEPAYDTVIESSPSSSADIPPAPIVTGPGLGDLLGLVLDPASQPVKGAHVILAGTGIEAKTDRNGTFLLRGLEEGTYGVVASAKGYADAAGTVAIRAGDTTRTWFKLGVLPPPPPHHVTKTFNGTLLVTSDPVTGWGSIICNGCLMHVEVEEGMASAILEFTMDLDSPVPVKPFPDPLGFGNQTTYWWFYRRCCYDWTGVGGNPLWARTDEALEAGDYTLDLSPNTYPAPETNRRFTVHLTLFYGEKAPVGWSYLAGSR